MKYVIIRHHKELNFTTGMIFKDCKILGKKDSGFYWSSDIDTVNGYFDKLGNDIVDFINSQLQFGYEIQVTEWSKDSESDPKKFPPPSKFFKIVDGETQEQDTPFTATINYHKIF